MKETDTAVPYRHGPYYYYTRTVEGKAYKIYCRSKELNGEEEVCEPRIVVFQRVIRKRRVFYLGCLCGRHKVVRYFLKRLKK